MKSSHRPLLSAPFALALLVLATLSACSSTPPAARPEFQGDLQVKVAEAKVSVPPSVVFRAGDTFGSAFRALGLLDGNTYIVEGDATAALPGNSTPILGADDAVAYFAAYGRTLTLSPVEGSKYVRVAVAKTPSASKEKASKNCDVTLAGTVPMGAVVTSIAARAGLDVSYADAGATAYAGVMYSVGFKGSCAAALEYMGRKADLAVRFDSKGVEFRMMDTATVDIGIPLRDRRIALDILADGMIANNSGVTNNSGSSSVSMGGAVNSGQGGGSKSLQSSYVTNYLSSVRSVLDSTRTQFGTWNYLPETGQIFIRDRAEAVAATKANLNRMAQAFYGRYEVTLTLYRMTSSRDKQVSGNLAATINNELSLTFGSPATALAASTVGISYDSGKRKSVVQLLSQFGAVETLDTFALTLQSGIPQTLKVANNTEYVRNVSTTISTTTSTTSTVEQANATDGAFVTMQARQAEVGKIAIDYGAFINRLDGFDTTETSSSIVKSQRGFERTFDSLAVVDDGVPYIASIVTQRTRTDDTQTLPGAEGAQGALSYVIPAIGGSKSDTSSQTYIVLMIEARKQ